MRHFYRRVYLNLILGLITILLLVSVVQPAQAQARSIRFETLSVDEGLSHSIVQAIAQDPRGFLWFGTEDGLNKFDGYTFTIFKHDPNNPDSISDNSINTLYVDTAGNVWIGTTRGMDRLVMKYDTFEHFLPDPSRSDSLSGPDVIAITEDRSGDLWIGTSGNGLNLYHRNTGKFTHFSTSTYPSESLANNQITALASDQLGGLWIGTTDGLDYFDPQTGSFTHYRNDPRDPRSISSNRIRVLYQDRFGILWIGTEDGGLNRYNPAGQEFTRYLPDQNNSSSISSSFIRAIYEDKNGQLWIGGRDGINLYNRDSNSFNRYQRIPGDPYSLSNDYILSILADHTGILWFGTYGGGISRYVQANERFTLFEHQPSVASSLSSDIINAIYEDRSGVVWIGTLDGGLNRVDPETGFISSIQHSQSDFTSLSNNEVRAIIEDQTGMLWIGTYGGGVNRLDRRTGQIIRYIHNPSNENSLSDSRVTALYEDSAGYLWIGTYTGGLDRLDLTTNTFTHFKNSPYDPSTISSDIIYTVYEDQEGKIWVGTSNGISIFDPDTGEFTHFQNDPDDPNSLSSNRVSTFYEAPDGTMWVGTLMGGLNRFDRISKKFKRYSQEDGLPNNSVCGILADSAGYLWMSTNWGLSRFDPRNETFRNYDRHDGLTSNEFSPGAYFQNNQGWLYFGGVQGFNTFDPSRVEDNPVAPPIVITAFKKFNQIEKIDLSGAEPIRLSYKDNFISFEFAALDYSAPEKNQYAYKLEGFNTDWVEAGTRRYASYTNLRGGTYEFHVIGSNPDGVWNEAGANITIVIEPPIWERWWFISSVFILLVGGGIAGYWIRIKQIQGQNRALERQVRDRTQEIERRREVAEGLREILSILNTNHTLKESLDAIILQVTRLMETQAVVIFRCNQDCSPIILASNLELLSAKTNGKDNPQLPEWILTPLIDGRSLLIKDMEEYVRIQPEAKNSIFGNFKSLMAVPLVIEDRADGGLVLLYNYVINLSDEDEQMAKTFADHAVLAIANAELRSQAEEIAVSAERSRLARELHDAVTQTLFATSLIAEVLPRLWDRNPAAGKEKIAEIRELTRGALAEMRTLLMELRPTALESAPLPDLLHQLSEAFTGRARIPVNQEINDWIDLPSPIKTSFYRIAQEAFNNIQKHSHAHQVTIKLDESDGQVNLSITDDGIGFNPVQTSPEHFGLGIMEERAEAIGAKFLVTTQMGQGTRILTSWTRTD